MDILSCFTCIFLFFGTAFFGCLTVALLKLLNSLTGKKATLSDEKDEIDAEEMDEKMRHIESLMNYDPYKTGRQVF